MASENTAFSTAGEDAISRTIDVQLDTTADQLSAQEFEGFYEIERVVEEIVKGDFKRIALQFPDELLHDSVPIYRALKSKIGSSQELYVLADTSYGSCCVDEVAAQHVDADAVVHFGYACLSQPSRLPVIYVFGQKSVDVDDCVAQFMEAFSNAAASSSSSDSNRPNTVLLRHDVAYTHQAEAIAAKLEEAVEPFKSNVLYSKIPTRLEPLASTSKAESVAPQNAEATGVPDSTVEDCTILYVGEESMGLTNMLMTHSSCDVYSYDPKTKRVQLQSLRTNRLLMRRYVAVQKAKDADVFGILVGTLGVASYLPLISHIRSLLSRSHKKSYTISVGKLNPSKLANFMEIECFVLVACPENSLIDAKDFLRPIVTPYELEVALRAEQSWTGRYVLDFEKLLSESSQENDPDEPTEEEDPDQPVFSLITGTYRHAKRYGDSSEAIENTSSAALVLRNQAGTVAKLADSAAGEFLQSRSYRGLESRIGEDAPSVLEQGRSGIARGYQDDHRES